MPLKWQLIMDTWSILSSTAGLNIDVQRGFR